MRKDSVRHARQTDRQTETETDKTRQNKFILLSGLRPITTGVNRDRQTQRDRDRETQRDRDRHRETETDTERQRQTNTERQRQTDTDRQR